MVLPGGGLALQQPVHVDDVAGAAAMAIGNGTSIGKTYNLSGSRPLTFRALVETAARAVGARAMLVPVPVQGLASALGALEALRVPMRLRAEQVLRIAEDKAFDHSEAVRDFGFRTRAFEQGVFEESRLMGLDSEGRG
jgi:nucleoside-diphosphate-sugar epimerase